MAGVECLLCHLVLPASTTDLFASHLQETHQVKHEAVLNIMVAEMARKVKDEKEIDVAKEIKQLLDKRETDENGNRDHDGLNTNPVEKESLVSTELAPRPEMSQLPSESATSVSTTSTSTTTTSMVPSSTDEKICETCGYSTVKASILKRHRKFHSREKPICDICGYSTSKASNLERHMKIHSSHSREKVSCDICGYSTTRASNLERHMKVHSKPARDSFPSLPYFHTLPSLYQDPRPPGPQASMAGNEAVMKEALEH